MVLRKRPRLNCKLIPLPVIGVFLLSLSFVQSSFAETFLSKGFLAILFSQSDIFAIVNEIDVVIVSIE